MKKQEGFSVLKSEALVYRGIKFYLTLAKKDKKNLFSLNLPALCPTFLLPVAVVWLLHEDHLICLFMLSSTLHYSLVSSALVCHKY